MDTQNIFYLINNIAFVLLAISPTIYVFGVTLLGTAIERARQEEEAARVNDKEYIQSEIDKLEKSLKKAKEDGDTSGITNKLEEFKKKQAKTNLKIRDIKIKYNRINLQNTVLLPCFTFILTIFASLEATFIKTNYASTLAFYLIIFFQMLLLFCGIIKLYYSLALVQEININKKESEYFNRLKDTFKNALIEYDQNIKGEVSIKFIEKAFPLNTTTSTELNLEFRVELEKGIILNNLYVLFFVPDGFELINPPESESFRQAKDYDIPNIRTVNIIIGNLSVGVYTSGSLKIKTPVSPGKYLLRYKICADGYNGSNQDLIILVG